MSQNPFEDTGRAGVFHSATADVDTLSKAALEARRKVIKAQIQSSGELASVLRELGQSLRFPDWYGANLDALHDCLSDPDWHAEPGLVLAVSGLKHLAASDPDGFSSLVEVFLSATEIRREAGKPLWVLIDVPAPGIPSLDI